MLIFQQELENHPVFETASGVERLENKCLTNDMGFCVRCNNYPEVGDTPFQMLKICYWVN